MTGSKGLCLFRPRLLHLCNALLSSSNDLFWPLTILERLGDSFWKMKIVFLCVHFLFCTICFPIHFFAINFHSTHHVLRNIPVYLKISNDTICIPKQLYSFWKKILHWMKWMPTLQLYLFLWIATFWPMMYYSKYDNLVDYQ